MSVTIVVNFQASEGNAAKLAALLQQGRDFSRKAEGCESFELFQRQDDPNKYMFLERGPLSRRIMRTWPRTWSRRAISTR